MKNTNCVNQGLSIVRLQRHNRGYSCRTYQHTQPKSCPPVQQNPLNSQIQPQRSQGAPLQRAHGMQQATAHSRAKLPWPSNFDLHAAFRSFLNQLA